MFDRIEEAYKRCKAHENAEGTPPGFFYYVVDSFTGNLEQMHHGTTDYALAAWRQLRRVWNGNVKLVQGVQGYMVPDGDGHRTIPEAALVIRTSRHSLFLTGCSWGYGGEGPHGTASILVDLGLFADMNEAMRFVADQLQHSTWELQVNQQAPVRDHETSRTWDEEHNFTTDAERHGHAT
jgi:hypothetical protein